MTYEIQVLDRDGLGIPAVKIMDTQDKVLALTNDNGYIKAELPGVVKVGTFFTKTQTVVLKPGVNVVNLEEVTFDLPEAEVIAYKDRGLIVWLYLFIFFFIIYNLSK